MRRSFPFIVEEISNKCNVFNYRRVEQNYYDIYPMLEMREANTKIKKYLYNRFKKHFRKGIKVWEYDLAKREWIFQRKHDKLPLSWVH